MSARVAPSPCSRTTTLQGNSVPISGSASTIGIEHGLFPVGFVQTGAELVLENQANGRSGVSGAATKKGNTRHFGNGPSRTPAAEKRISAQMEYGAKSNTGPNRMRGQIEYGAQID